MAGCAAAGQGDSRRSREGAPDAARRSAHDLRGRSDAVWLRRVHPPRDLAGDAARDSAEQALVAGGIGQGEGAKAPSPSTSLRADENRTVQVAGDSRWKHQRERIGRVPTRGSVVSALFFFPRGGSAQVTRSLARALPAV